MITPQGKVMVLDFGLARSQNSLTLTEGGAGIGTPRYMAPEQFLGARDPRVDQFALGLIAYELLTGATPINSDDWLQLLQEMVNRPEVPLPRPSRPLPPALEAVIMRMLAKNPGERFADVAQALEAWRQGLRECGQAVLA